MKPQTRSVGTGLCQTKLILALPDRHVQTRENSTTEANWHILLYWDLIHRVNFFKVQHFRSQLCFHFQAKKHLT